MAAYDYRCNNCCQLFEVRRRVAEEPKPVECPLCLSNDTQRHWSPPNLLRRSAPPNDSANTPKLDDKRRGDLYIEGTTFQDCGTGIDVEGAHVRAKNLTMRRVSRGVRAKNSTVEIEGVSIE